MALYYLYDVVVCPHTSRNKSENRDGDGVVRGRSRHTNKNKQVSYHQQRSFEQLKRHMVVESQPKIGAGTGWTVIKKVLRSMGTKEYISVR